MHLGTIGTALLLFTAGCQSDNGAKSSTGSDGGGGGMTGGGSGWTKIYESTDLLNGNTITVDGDYIIVGLEKGVRVSHDDGATWEAHSTGLPDSSVVALIALDDRVLAGLIGAPVVYVSMDHGSTWKQSDSGLPQSTDAYAFFKTASTVFVGMASGASDPGAEGGLFRSADKGATWAKSSTGIPQNYSATAFTMIGSKLFCSAGSSLATSSDDGMTWQTQTLSGGNPLGLATLDGALFVATSSGPSLDSAVSKSSDQGGTWSDASKGLPSKDPADFLFQTGKNLYAMEFANDDNGVFISTDSGSSWSAYNENLDDLVAGIFPRIVAMATHGTYLFAVEDVGNVWRRAL